MTTEQFKKDYPEYALLEGNELWYKMAEVIMGHQSADNIIKQRLPFYKRYRLRWLFYRKTPNMFFTKEWQSKTVCANCKSGTTTRIYFMRTAICINCSQELKEVPNRRIKYLLWLAYKPVERLFWLILDKIHLIRSSDAGRYEMFGDEACYVKHYILNMPEYKSTPVLLDRKWYEYIFIRK